MLKGEEEKGMNWERHNRKLRLGKHFNMREGVVEFLSVDDNGKMLWKGCWKERGSKKRLRM